VPLVTNRGRFTEDCWQIETNGVRLASGASAAELSAHVEALLALSHADRAAVGEAGRRWYEAHFSLSRTVATLREGHAK
jgi:hypothetical protein